MQKRVFVTGIDGFTGRYLQAELVRRGWSVAGLVRETGQRNLAHNEYVAELCDEDALAAAIKAVRPHAVVHLAAVAHVAYGDVEEMYRTNILGTRALLSVVHQFAPEVDAVVLASSANVYGNASVELLTEDCVVQPANDYGVSKLAMEYLARTWMNRLPITIVRPFNYTGAGQSTSFVIPKIVQHFRDRVGAIELGNIDVFRDYSDVRDVASAYSDLIERPQPTQIFNVASGVTRSLREVMQKLTQMTGHEIAPRVRADLIRANEIRSLCGDATKLRAVSIHFSPRPFDETLEWMLKAR
jgi:GDP-6-deoxy-D-talose 4-dehydrogenase